MCICVPQSQDGYAYNALLASLFHQCLYRPIEIFAFGLGLLNILFWLVAQFPQLITNFVNGDVEALSPLFIFQWLLGDVCNLVGCIFTRQYKTQLYTAIYYVFMDVLMLGQYGYYVYLKPIWKGTATPTAQRRAEQRRQNAINNGQDADYGTMYASMAVLFSMSLVVKIAMGATSSPSNKDVELCDQAAPIAEWEHIMGIIASWVSGILYFTARIPQVYLNWKRKSVEGLSFPMFFCAVMGNLCYGLSVLLPGIKDWKRFFIEVFPYILGSLCTISMSFMIVLQFVAYSWIPSFRQHGIMCLFRSKKRQETSDESDRDLLSASNRPDLVENSI